MPIAPTRSTSRAALAPFFAAAALALIVTCAGTPCVPLASTEAAVSELRPLEKLIRETWDFTKPTVSEQRFRTLAAHEPAARVAARALYDTQVARALGLQQQFDAAQAVLHTIAEVTDWSQIWLKTQKIEGKKAKDGK